MKVFKYLLVLLFLFSLTSQVNVADEIKTKFFSKIKTLLKKRGSFDYKNDILSPKNILSKTLIIDRVELNNVKINEIGKRYNLESKAIDQIRAAFFASQPNVYKDFEFSLNSANLNQIVNFATFTEYIGCCFRQDNMINYIILRLSVNSQIYEKRVFDRNDCIRLQRIFYYAKIERLKEECNKDPYCVLTVNHKACPFDGYLRTYYKRRPLNNAEKFKANNLIRTYSGEMFNLMIEEIEKKTIKTEENLVVQSVFTTGQVFKNESYCVQAMITDYGDIEIRGTSYKRKPALLKKECQSLTASSFFDITEKCQYNPSCDERKNEYLIADKDGKSSCTKLKELRKEKKNIKMEIYTDGSMAIKSAGGILFYTKPNIKGKGPFSVGVTKGFELQIIDSQKVVVWKSTPAFLHDVQKKIEGEDNLSNLFINIAKSFKKFNKN